MLRHLMISLAALVTLALVPSAVAAAGGPSPGLMQGWTGVSSSRTPLRFVTLPAGASTVLASVRKSDGRVLSWRALRRTWGIPMVANDGTTGGLSQDGRVLVLADWAVPANGGLRPVSQFKLVNTKTLRVWRTISLHGDFTFDALSPGGRTLYLIEHVSQVDATRYLVRAYDVGASRLLPGAIADRRQQGWVMRGYPVTRATSAGGQWVYTLYQQPGGYAFVHALDAVNRTAICVGIPWQGALPKARLRLDEGHGTLTVAGPGGREFAIDTATFQVSLPRQGGDGFPVALVAAPAGALAALALFALGLRRRLRPRADRSFEGLSA
jgi:hypothetical protein